MNKLTPTSEKLVKAFDDAAQNWGWTRDQGSGSQVAEDKTAYEATAAALRKRIAHLERRASVGRLIQSNARRDLGLAKAALTTRHISVKADNGRLMTVENPFFRP